MTSRRGGGDKEEERRRRALIKSNSPHLAGGDLKFVSRDFLLGLVISVSSEPTPAALSLSCHLTAL